MWRLTFYFVKITYNYQFHNYENTNVIIQEDMVNVMD